MKTLLQVASLLLLGIAFGFAHADLPHIQHVHRGGEIGSVGQMQAPRAAHTMTTLHDGRVLIAGGCTARSCDPGQHASTGELFDPATGAFTLAGSMHSARVSHAATLLPSGDVLITGGWDRGNAVSSAEIYRVKTGVFEQIASLPAPRASHTQTLLDNGKVLLVGGHDGNSILGSAVLFHPDTGTFSETGGLQTPRNSHVAVQLQDGRVMIIAGGDTYNDVVLASAEVYDPETGRFTEVGALRTPRYKHAATLLKDGRVLVVGGSDERDSRGRYTSAEIFDPSTGQFTETAAMASPRFKLPHAITTLPNGWVLVAGGDEHAEVFDPNREIFLPIPGSMGAGRSFASVAMLQGGNVMISGGYDPQIRVSNSAWLYEER